MNKIILFIILFTNLIGFAQDTLILKSGDTLQGKIISVDNNHNVHFKNNNGNTLLIAHNSIRQSDSAIADSTMKAKSWQRGYIVYKKSKDTLFGYTKIQTTRFNEPVKVWFRKDKEVKKGTLEFNGYPLPTSDTLHFFSYLNKKYKYMNYKDEASNTKKMFKTYIWGWAEILEQQGEIKLSRGFCNVRFSIGQYGGGRTGTPCVCLKKNDEPTLLLDDEIPFVPGLEQFLANGLSKKDQARLIEYISNYPELTMKWKDSVIKFGDVQKIVREYNQWAKNNNKQ